LHNVRLGLRRAPAHWGQPVRFDGHFYFFAQGATRYTSVDVFWIQHVQHSSERFRDPQRLSKALIANYDVRMSLEVLHHSFRRIHLISRPLIELGGVPPDR
jgi:hypothetical protein